LGRATPAGKAKKSRCVGEKRSKEKSLAGSTAFANLPGQGGEAVESRKQNWLNESGKKKSDELDLEEKKNTEIGSAWDLGERRGQGRKSGDDEKRRVEGETAPKYKSIQGIQKGEAL